MNWGTKGRSFTNFFWIRNPYADQMQALKPGEPDYEAVKQGYLASRAVAQFIADPAISIPSSARVTTQPWCGTNLLIRFSPIDTWSK